MVYRSIFAFQSMSYANHHRHMAGKGNIKFIGSFHHLIKNLQLHPRVYFKKIVALVLICCNFLNSLLLGGYCIAIK